MARLTRAATEPALRPSLPLATSRQGRGARHARSFRARASSSRPNLAAASSRSLGNISRFSGNTDHQRRNVSPDETLRRIVDSVSASLRSSGEIDDVAFEPVGCRWTALLSRRADGVSFSRRFGMEVVVSSASSSSRSEDDHNNNDNHDTNDHNNNHNKDDESRDFHVIHVVFVPGPDVDESDPEFEQAKDIFDAMATNLQGAIVRCQFPAFPEGDSGKTFKQCYQLNQKLNKGTYATVCRGTHRETRTAVAVKIIFRKNLTPEQQACTYEEVSIMSSLYHPHIIPLIDFFEEDQCFYLVMELMEGGDLFDRVGKLRKYSEKDGRLLCKRILEAVNYCHLSKVAHNDIKPKNIMLLSQTDDANIKLADFGFAARITGPKCLKRQCGTPYYVAPEILRREPYDEGADMWSVGVMVYLLLSGKLPFVGRNFAELSRAIVRGVYDFPDDRWASVSDEARSLVRGLLVMDPARRYDARRALDHDWFRARTDEELETHDLGESSKDLRVFNSRMALRGSVMAVMAATSVLPDRLLSSSSTTTTTNENGDRGDDH